MAQTWYHRRIDLALILTGLRRLWKGRLLIAVFAGSILIYHANLDDPWAASDTLPAPYVAWTLVRYQTFDLSPYAGILGRYSGDSHVAAIKRTKSGSKMISKYPPGSAIMAAPFFLFASRFDRGMYRKMPAMLAIGKTVGATYAALATMLFLITVRRLFPKAALLSTVLLGFGTTVWSTASQALWQHGPAVFLISAMLLILTVRKPRHPFYIGLAAGVATGMSIVIRPPLVAFHLGLVSWLLIQKNWRTALGLATASLPFAGLLVLYNFHYTGTLFAGGYGSELRLWHTPLWLGLAGLLAAPSRGLFFYTPAIIVAGFGAVALVSRRSKLSRFQRCTLVGSTLGFGLTLGLYAKWHQWNGGWSYGPRLLTEMMPIVCLLFALGYQQLPSRRARYLARVLVFLSVVIHLVGVFGFGIGAEWHQRHNLLPHATDLFDVADNQVWWGVVSLIRKIAGLFS